MDAIATIAQMVREAEAHADSMSKDRIRATEYYRGEMKDTPAVPNRSTMVKRLVRAQVKKVLPSLSRTILGSDQVTEYMPVGPNDEQGAQQATDYINFVIVPEANVRPTIEDGLHDALLLRNGILKWWWDEKTEAKVSRHSGLDDQSFALLAGDPEVEVLEHTEAEEFVGDQPILTHDLKIRRTTRKGKVCTAAVARENFLIHPDALDLDASPIVGEKTEISRSTLVAMGYDKGTVYSLGASNDDDTEESLRRDVTEKSEDLHPANVLVDYYDLYVRFDRDEDGIAELRHMCFAGGLGEKNLLLDEECDEVQYCDIKVMSQPHQWEGISLADDLMDLQRAQTVLLRQTLDILYWQNGAQPVMQEGAVLNPEAVINPEFGLPIRLRQGTDARAAIGYDVKPFVADKSFGMLEYMDNEATERTGVSDASSGLAPDALQNMTAKASAMIEQAGIGQTELMVRTAAEGLRRFFRGILRLIIRHQDIPRTVRLRDEWVQFDPRQWNADMDCNVNTGLGAGTRERDMMVMQHVIMLQEKLLAAFGPDNPFVKPDQVYNGVAKMIEAAGLRTPSLYFTEPDPQEVQAKMQAATQQPSPEQIKAEAQMQVEQMKAQAQGQMKQIELQSDMQLEDKRMQMQANKELAQMQADKETEADRRKTEVMLKQMQIAWEREKLIMEQRAMLAPQGLDVDDEGQQVNPFMEMLKQTQQMMAVLGQQMQASNMPKRVVRDMNGEVIGLEPMGMN